MRSLCTPPDFILLPSCVFFVRLRAHPFANRPLPQAFPVSLQVGPLPLLGFPRPLPVRRMPAPNRSTPKSPTPMKKYAFATRTGAAALMFALCLPAFGQQSQNQTEEEVVRLSPFAVTESANMGRYQAAEATSGTRVRMDLMDSTQSISVVTNEFMQDIGTARLNEVVKYVAGIGSASESHALDTMFIRGFFAQGATIDGFNQYNWINQDPIITDRIEVVKGPNAILAPQGLPGGVVNNVSKKPFFTNEGSLSYQVGHWDSNRAELDANYVVRPNKLAVRVVGAFTDADDYGQGEFHQNITVMPMFTYRLSPQIDFTVQLQAYNASVLANNGNPISVYAVGRSNVRLQEGLPRNFQMVGRNITRHQSGQNLRFFLNSQITDKLSMRLAGNVVEQNTRTNFLGPSLPNISVIALDQITGEWSWDGVTRNDSPTYKLGGGNEWISQNYGNLQNDFVYEHTASTWKAQTIGGYAINYSSQHFQRKSYVDDPTDYDFTTKYTPPAYTLEPDWSNNSSSRSRSHQIYLSEVISIFKDRLVLSGSLSQNRYFSDFKNNLHTERRQSRAGVTLPSGGVVYKVTPSVSLYYGYSKQELDGGEDPDSGIPKHTVPSRQHEGGIRWKLFDGKLYTTLAYFDILQQNIITQNYANYITPRPDPLLPNIMSNRTAKGFEFEIAWAPTKSFSLIGSYTDFKNRDNDNERYAGAAEELASIWIQYSFTEPPLRGLKVGIGANYMGERPGDLSAGTYTTPPPGYAPVRIQTTYWLPSYIVAEASASYHFSKHWSATLFIKNLFDTEYFVGSFNRIINVNTPINPKLTVRYEF